MPVDISTLSEERIAYLEGLVGRARAAASVFTQFSQEDVDRIVKAMVLAGMEKAQYLARLAIEETGLGVLEDKAIKNMVATEFVYNYVRDKRTVGVIREFPERGLAGGCGAHRRHLLGYTDHQSHRHGSVQMHHGHQDAKRGDLRTAPQGMALLPGGHPDHVRGGGKHGAPEGVFTCLEEPTIPDNA